MSQTPAPSPDEIRDREHLKLLAIFYYIMGGITMVFSCFGLLYVGMGAFMILAPDALHGPKGQPPPPPFFGFMVVALGTFIVLLGWTVGSLSLVAGRSLQTHRRWLFTLIVAGLNCINCVFFPAGIILGAFTFVVMLRDSVRKLYESVPARDVHGF